MGIAITDAGMTLTCDGDHGAEAAKETFHGGWEPGTTANHPTLGPYDDRLAQTLEHFKAWKEKAK